MWPGSPISGPEALLCNMGYQKPTCTVLARAHVPFSAQPSHSFKVSNRRHAEVDPESFGIVVCRFAGTVTDILGLVWPSFRPESGSKSKVPDRILNLAVLKQIFNFVLGPGGPRGGSGLPFS